MVDGIPRLLAPEALAPAGGDLGVDLDDPRYAEAYAEMEHYDAVSAQEVRGIERSQPARAVQPVLDASPAERETFPSPVDAWLDAVYDAAAQYDAYAHVAEVRRGTVLQLGGKGIHAVKLLLAGAREAWVVSPMAGELHSARALAAYADVGDRLHVVAAIGEELPFADGSIDVVYSGGSIHHTVTDLVFPEIARVLRPGGRFAAFDPWHAPLYSLGTRVFGKRETNVHCRPLTDERVGSLAGAFRETRIVHHGTFSRYPLIALGKLGVRSSVRFVWRVTSLDDALAARLRSRRFGSSVALLATR